MDIGYLIFIVFLFTPVLYTAYIWDRCRRQYMDINGADIIVPVADTLVLILYGIALLIERTFDKPKPFILSQDTKIYYIVSAIMQHTYQVIICMFALLIILKISEDYDEIY